MIDNWTAIAAIATLLGAVGTFSAILVALFQDRLRGCFFREALRVEFDETASPCSQSTHIPNAANPANPILCWAIRLRVRNLGNAPAENVEVMCEEILDQPNFVPANFKWTQRESRTLNYVAPHGGFAYFDLGYHFAGRLKIATLTELPNHHQLLNPGTHAFAVSITSRAGIAARCTIHLSFAVNPNPVPAGVVLIPSVSLQITHFALGPLRQFGYGGCSCH